MKRVLFSIVLFLLLLSWPNAAPQSACQIGPGKKVPVQVVFHGDKDNGSSIIVNDVTRFRNPAQCTNPAPSTTYTISCDEDTETFAADSIFAPLCGSSVERGKANSSCYSCGSGVIKCDGFDWTLGESSSIFNTHERCPFDKDNPNWSGDVWCSPPDPKVLSDKKFTYNGKEYDYNGEQIIACGSNVQACGASEACTNLAHPDVTNRGNNEQAHQNGQPPGAGTGGKEQKIYADPATNPGEPLTGSIGLGIVSKLPSVAANIFARIRYASDNIGERIFEMFPNFARFGPIFERTAFTDLLPAQFIGQYNALDAGDKPKRTPLKGMSSYRLCIPNSDIPQPDGAVKDSLTLSGLTVTKENIGSKSYPRFWAQYVGGTNYLPSIFLNGVTRGLNYIGVNGNLVDFDTIEEKDSNGNVQYFYKEKNWKDLDNVTYQCGAATNGQPATRVTTKASGEARTGGGSGGGFLEGLQAIIYRAAFQLYRCKEDDQDEDCATAGQSLHQTDSITAGITAASQTIGLDTDQLAKMPAYKQAALIEAGGGVKEKGTAGGIVRAFLSSEFTKNIDYQNAQTIQKQAFAFAKEGVNEGVQRFAYPRWMKSMIDGLACMENAYTPKELQKPDAWCRYSQGEGEPYPGTADRGVGQWTTAPTIPPSFEINDTDVKKAIEEASKDQIPACVLEGVKFIESGTDWSDAQYCSVNSCSAAGPFQITTGWAPDPNAPGGWDNHCRMCGGNNPDSSWITGQRDCPDGWPGNWPMTPTDPSPCEAGPAAKQAVAMLQAKAQYWTQKVLGTAQTLNSTDSIQSQRDAIMLAADSYWGKTATIERLGGCTYGEYVYKHCDPSYECTGNPPVSIPKP